MRTGQKSSSIEQVLAEEKIFTLVEKSLNVSLEKNPKLYLSNNEYTYIQPDFYSEVEPIVGEIFAHIGNPKPAQNHKIANDILKMLLLEKITKQQYRKILVVCDEAEYKTLCGRSALAESIRQFDIEVLFIEVDGAMKTQLLEAQQRQKMINA